MNMPAVKLLVTVGSAATIGFGVWHFFAPRIWSWYSYFDPSAVELVLAVRAINVLFSLSLVLFGLMDLLAVWGGSGHRHFVPIVLGATCVLWTARVVMQVASPQGSMSAPLQYGMLLGFSMVLACFSAALILALFGHNVR